MHKKIGVIVGVVCFTSLLGLAFWGLYAPMEGPKGALRSFTHSKGVTEIPVHPKRIAVFNPGMVDLLRILEVPIAGLAKGGRGGYPSLPLRMNQYNSDEYVHIGTLKEPDFEALSHLAPDLIIADARGEKSYDELSKIAPTVLLALNNQDLEKSLKDLTRVVGDLFGKEKKAEELISDFERNIEKAKSLAQGKTALSVMTNGGKISTFGPNNRFAFVSDSLGFQNVYQNPPEDRRANVISPEFILSMDPQWIFVVDRDTAVAASSNNEAGKAVMANPLIEKTQAYKAGQIVYLDGAALYLMANIITFNDLTKQVIEVLSR